LPCRRGQTSFFVIDQLSDIAQSAETVDNQNVVYQTNSEITVVETIVENQQTFQEQAAFIVQLQGKKTWYPKHSDVITIDSEDYAPVPEQFMLKYFRSRFFLVNSANQEKEIPNRDLVGGLFSKLMIEETSTYKETDFVYFTVLR